jgi:CelD/BcsL family acetyltransferase involved in cellulose biosynthesis
VTLEIHTADGPAGFGDPREWNRLVATSPGGSFFQTAQWCTAWWEELAGQPELSVVRIRDNGTLVGAGALAVVRLPLSRALRIDAAAVTNAGSGAGAADHCGFPVAPTASQDVIDRLWHWILERSADRSLLLANLDPETAIARLARETFHPIGDERCPRTSVPAGTSFDVIRAGWTRNRRKTIAKKLRDFETAGGRFEWIDEPEQVVEALPRVFALHHARRNSIHGATTFGATPENRAFHEKLARGADSLCACWVQLARTNDGVAGALYGFRMGSTYSVYQSGWDGAWGDMSLGLIQYSEALRNTVERGGTVFDMCRGTDAYKLRFATETRTEVSYARTHGVSGVLLRGRWATRRRRRNYESDELETASEYTESS